LCVTPHLLSFCSCCSGCSAYLPGVAMRRIAELHPGEAKPDPKDAYVIADVVRVMPHTLRRVDVGEEALAELKVLMGFVHDPASEATRVVNRIRGLLTQMHPARMGVPPTFLEAK
jgi:hypothetical protein